MIGQTAEHLLDPWEAGCLRHGPDPDADGGPAAAAAADWVDVPIPPPAPIHSTASLRRPPAAALVALGVSLLLHAALAAAALVVIGLSGKSYTAARVTWGWGDGAAEAGAYDRSGAVGAELGPTGSGLPGSVPTNAAAGGPGGLTAAAAADAPAPEVEPPAAPAPPVPGELAAAEATAERFGPPADPVSVTAALRVGRALPASAEAPVIPAAPAPTPSPEQSADVPQPPDGSAGAETSPARRDGAASGPPGGTAATGAGSASTGDSGGGGGTGSAPTGNGTADAGGGDRGRGTGGGPGGGGATTGDGGTALTGRPGIPAGVKGRGLAAPAYPDASRRRGDEGTVVLAVEVLASGRAGRITVVSDAGHPRLAQAAAAAVRKAEFTPARRDGVPVTDTLTIPFTFRLK